MNTGPEEVQSDWSRAARAAALFAVDPAGLQGIVLRSAPGPVRDQWLAQLQAMLPPDTPWRRLPLHIGDDRLLGGLDLSATLRSGRPVSERGLLATCDGGVLLIAMAERVETGVAARLAAVLDSGVVAVERGGVSQRIPSRLSMIALDEGIGEEESVPRALADRFAIHLDLGSMPVQTVGSPAVDSGAIAAAVERLPAVVMEERMMDALCTAAVGFGIESLRIPVLAIRVARAAAALADRTVVSEEDVALAAQLVFGCRATRLPEREPEEAPAESSADATEPDPPGEPDHQQQDTRRPEPDEQQAEKNGQPPEPQPLDDQVLEATRAAIPSQLLQQLHYPDPTRGGAARSSARSAARRRPARRGRPVGTRRGEPGDGARLNLVETLRAAAPWQRLRRSGDAATHGAALPAVRVYREDLRINRYQQRAATTTVFAVDASGSAALHRLAEVKGAVELLLAESYQRRDQVALVSFRGTQPELMLPPTRSLVRAKRCLAALPGGGGTPLAAGINLALETALGIQRREETPVIILLTDGRANVTLDGCADRDRAEAEAHEAARRIRAGGITALLVDTSPRPRPAAKELAGAMGALYLGLPHANAERLTGAARALLPGQSGTGRSREGVRI